MESNSQFCTDFRTIFQERRLPEPASLAGYAALISEFDLAVPPPYVLSAISRKHVEPYEEENWRVFGKRYQPDPDLAAHLQFALKYEGVDLAVLARLFRAVGPEAIRQIVAEQPTGVYSRRIWFLYEWLTNTSLDLPDAPGGRYAAVLNPDHQYGRVGEPVTRFRLHDNLPGTPQFCPLIFRSEYLREQEGARLAERSQAILSKTPADLTARTAAFLLLDDSRASYAIEGERAPQSRVQRWARAIGQAGRHAIDAQELTRLQRIVLGDTPFVSPGLRDDGGFVGEHDRRDRKPIPRHISARSEDLPDLVAGMALFDESFSTDLDPVIAAAVLSFGFVYVHPFVDGNGRIHRYLIHHTFARHGLNPKGVVFPISAVILDRLAEYRDALESYSVRLLPLIEWEETDTHNVRVLNDTADFYRYFDATPHAEFLYRCANEAVDTVIPNEVDFLRRYDSFDRMIGEIVEMPDSTVDLLFRFLQENGGRLSNRARAREFAALTEEQLTRVEEAFSRAIER